MHFSGRAGLLSAVFVSTLATAAAAGESPTRLAALTIPDVSATAKRSITIDDVVGLRNVDVLSVSPDGKRYAVFLHQNDRKSNEVLNGWFIADVRGGSLVSAGGGGKLGPAIRASGHIVGELTSPLARWSPDSQWIAYTVDSGDEVQIWRSRADGSLQEQLTRNGADVRDFAWSEDGQLIYFGTASSRADDKERKKQRDFQGYRYDYDIATFSDFMLPHLLSPPEPVTNTWTFRLADRSEKRATEAEEGAYKRALARLAGGTEAMEGFANNAKIEPARHANGSAAWLERTANASRNLQLVASLKGSDDKAVRCEAEPCIGTIRKVWWSDDGRQVFFWRTGGLNEMTTSFYAWTPATQKLVLKLQTQEDYWTLCDPAPGDRLLCARETHGIPPHVAAVDFKRGATSVLADVNPEFRNIRLGRVERFEFDTPTFPWAAPGQPLAGLYAKRAVGYILYPPDFDPKRKYPVFIDPYTAFGFERSAGGEHPQHVYAANGFVVINTAFPHINDIGSRLGANSMTLLYSEELNFPHLTMFAESTLRGLDTVVARGFIDDRRTGIGGVSHGTFVPLFMMKNHDRIAAISISSPSWGPHEYYWGTRAIENLNKLAFKSIGYQEWRPDPRTPAGKQFWDKIDIAEHVDQLEAPVLMNLSAGETFALLKLIRYLGNADLPYDAYVYSNETHFKWQPAHIYTTMVRNLDWFRFWLQDVEDPAPEKKEQYAHWRELRQLQCRNPRSLRNYCGS